MCKAFDFLLVSDKVKNSLPFVLSLRSRLVHVLYQYLRTS